MHGHYRPVYRSTQRRHDNSLKKGFELSLEKVKKQLLPYKLHLRTDADVERQPARFPQSNKNTQSQKQKSMWRRHSRDGSLNDITSNLQGLLYLQSHKPSKRHSLKDDIHQISINKSTFINRKSSATNSQQHSSVDKMTKDLSPYKNSLTKLKTKQDNLMRSRQQTSGKLKRNIEKLKTQESQDYPQTTKEATQKTTPESYNLIMTSMKPKEVLSKYANHLTLFEQAEILEYDSVHFVSKNPPREPRGYENLGFDDKKGHYVCYLHDHVAYRFEVLDEMGRGSFGQVVRAYDHKTKTFVALKIIKNKKTPNSQARIEYSILKYLKEADDDGCNNVVQVLYAFQFRKHFCMTFELLSFNLYELIKNNKFLPLSSYLIRRISIQILSTLLFLYKHNIIHCDIKPENILLKTSDKSGIKVIDFGSSCFSDQKLYTYIQSRYYRAPEVILGYDYSMEIDMWSFGCVAAYLKLSYPIFSGENEDEQVALITEVIGPPDASFWKNTERGESYFGDDTPRLKDRDGMEIEAKSRLLTNLFQDEDFADFLSRIFIWNPHQRITPLYALKHRWIVKGLPNEIRQQHLQYLAEYYQQLQSIMKKRAMLRPDKTNARHHGRSHTFSEYLLMKALKSVE